MRLFIQVNMPTKFFEITFYDKNHDFCDLIQKNFGKGAGYFINKYNQYFNKLKFPFGRFIRIQVRRDNSNFFIGNPIKGLYWALNVVYPNFDMEAFFQKSDDQKKDEILMILQKTSKAVCEKFNFDYEAFDECFQQLLASDYKTYHKRVSKIFVSTSKDIKAWFLHEIEISSTDIFLVVEKKGEKDSYRIPIYLNNDFGDIAFSYLDGETIWLDDRYLVVKNETKEVIHIIDTENLSFEVKFAPQKGWSEKYLFIKLQKELSRTHEEWVSLNKELNIEFRTLQEKFWLDHSK